MPSHASSSSLTVLSDGGCARSCASRRSDPGSGAVPTIINAGQMRTSQVSDCSHYPQPAIKRDAPDEETNDWRAVCGRTASTVRREGRRRAFPTPIVFLSALQARRGWPGHRRAEATPSFGRLWRAEATPSFGRLWRAEATPSFGRLWRAEATPSFGRLWRAMTRTAYPVAICPRRHPVAKRPARINESGQQGCAVLEITRLQLLIRNACWPKGYFVTRCFVGVTVFGAASEIANVNQVFQPDGRLAASNSP